MHNPTEPDCPRKPSFLRDPLPRRESEASHLRRRLRAQRRILEHRLAAGDTFDTIEHGNRIVQVDHRQGFKEEIAEIDRRLAEVDGPLRAHVGDHGRERIRRCFGGARRLRLPDDPPPRGVLDVVRRILPRRTSPAARRPRTISRSSSRSGDSGDDDPGEPEPPSRRPRALGGPSPRFSRPWRPQLERDVAERLRALDDLGGRP